MLVLQHFFPSFEEVEVKWESELVPYLEKAMVEQSPEEFEDFLNQLLVKLEDGQSLSPSPLNINSIKDYAI